MTPSEIAARLRTMADKHTMGVGTSIEMRLLAAEVEALAAPAPPQREWEHKYLRDDSSEFYGADLVERLNESWELVSATADQGTWLAILRRPRADAEGRRRVWNEGRIDPPPRQEGPDLRGLLTAYLAKHMCDDEDALLTAIVAALEARR